MDSRQPAEAADLGRVFGTSPDYWLNLDHAWQRRAVGIEIEERYCEIAARRLSQTTLDLQPEPAQPEHMPLEVLPCP